MKMRIDSRAGNIVVERAPRCRERNEVIMRSMDQVISDFEEEEQFVLGPSFLEGWPTQGIHVFLGVSVFAGMVPCDEPGCPLVQLFQFINLGGFTGVPDTTSVI